VAKKVATNTRIKEKIIRALVAKKVATNTRIKEKIIRA